MKPYLAMPILLMLGACGNRTQPAADPAPGPDPSWTGLAKPMEVIHARGKVMEQMELLMVPIDTIQVEPVRNADQLRMNARTISALLLALPHLFPPTTNLYDSKATEPSTIALPTIWKNFDTFYQLATTSSRVAGEMGSAQADAELRAAGNKLRAACTTCHTLFLRKYVPQKPQASDQEFDFDAAVGNDKK